MTHTERKENFVRELAALLEKYNVEIDIGYAEGYNIGVDFDFCSRYDEEGNQVMEYDSVNGPLWITKDLKVEDIK